MPFLVADDEVCRKERASFSLNVSVQKKEATISDVGKRCCSKELHDSKTKKTKVEFPMDKPKATKTKHKDGG
jgi:hypothetical protein